MLGPGSSRYEPIVISDESSDSEDTVQLLMPQTVYDESMEATQIWASQLRRTELETAVANLCCDFAYSVTNAKDTVFCDDGETNDEGLDKATRQSVDDSAMARAALKRKRSASKIELDITEDSVPQLTSIEDIRSVSLCEVHLGKDKRQRLSKQFREPESVDANQNPCIEPLDSCHYFSRMSLPRQSPVPISGMDVQFRSVSLAPTHTVYSGPVLMPPTASATGKSVFSSAFSSVPEAMVHTHSTPEARNASAPWSNRLSKDDTVLSHVKTLLQGNVSSNNSNLVAGQRGSIPGTGQLYSNMHNRISATDRLCQLTFSRPSNRIIGANAMPNSSQGLYPKTCRVYPKGQTLIMENIPRKSRNREFFNSWCLAACGCLPVQVESLNGNGKAIIEFHTERQAQQAFRSPRFEHDSCLSGIRVYWYRSYFAPANVAGISRDSQMNLMDNIQLPRFRPISVNQPQINTIYQSGTHQAYVTSSSTVQGDSEEGEIAEGIDNVNPMQFADLQPGYRGSNSALHASKEIESRTLIDPLPVSLNQCSSERISVSSDRDTLPIRMDANTMFENENRTTNNGQDYDDTKMVTDERKTTQVEVQSEDVDLFQTRPLSPTPDVNPFSIATDDDNLTEFRGPVLSSKRNTTPVNEGTQDSLETGLNDTDSITSSGLPKLDEATTSTAISSILSDDSLNNSTPALSIPNSSTSTCITPIAPSLEDLATNLIEDTLVSIAHAHKPSEISSSTSRASVIQSKQRRLEQHIAESKKFMNDFVEASSKAEKNRIKSIIHERNKQFDEDSAAFDVILKKLSKRSNFIRWPQTTMDDTILILSDSDEDSSSDQELDGM